MTDSSTTPLRRGIMGKSIGFRGFNPLRNYIGTKDIFGRTMDVSQTNIVDSLSAMAVYLMGEGNEKIPMLLMRGIPNIQFTSKDMYKDFVIPPAKDLYRPLLEAFNR